MTKQLTKGSAWHRWDPHIHSPGTILSDHYPAADGWEEFLTRIETSEPRVRALGITDYFSTATYEQVVAHKKVGRLPDVDLIFPNVELRLGVGTARGSPVNIHLLVSPDDTDHVARLHAFLSDLRFEALGERYRCTPVDIMRLGRAHDANATSEERALEVGSNQFKVDLANLREAMKASDWARANILIAVAASSTDGTAGLQGDASLARLRREIERAAHIIFSGNPSDRMFWLGRGAVTRQVLIAEYNGPKPCLHGSDAHRPEMVSAPKQDRRCWLKGSFTFETLRQACLEPEMRVFVGTAAPPSAQPSQVITEVAVQGAPFLRDAKVPLNAGLIGIIGARGSGKTALADLIAVGGSAFSLEANRLSFVYRARDHLAGARVDLTWDDGSACGETIEGLSSGADGDDPQVRYLSQQFVDRLCSAEGLTDELLAEIQRVIFLAHPTEERLGATDFGQLLDLRAESARTARQRAEDELRDLSTEFVGEREKEASIAPLRAKLTGIRGTITKAQADRTALVAKSGGDQARLTAYNVVAEALQKRRSEHEQLERRRNALDTLAREVELYRSRTFPDTLRQMRQRHEAALMPEALWPRFELKFAGDVDGAITGERAAVVASLTALAGTPLPSATGASPAAVSYLPQDVALATLPIATLAAEAQRVEGLIRVDRAAAKSLATLNSRIAADEGQAANLQRQIEAAERAPARLLAIRDERRSAYTRVFKALISEQSELTSLYAPLAIRIEAESGSARKLSFEVRRRVDVEAWARKGEMLLDLRKGSTLRKGSLADLARASLMPAWTTGTAEEVSTALAQFREAYDAAIIECCPYDRRDAAQAEADAPELDRAAIVLESYLVRRMVGNYQTRAYANLALRLQKQLVEAPEAPSTVLASALAAEKGADAWPSDEEFRQEWLRRRFYGSLRRERVLMILKAIELRLQTAKHLAEPLMDFDWKQLQIEHIMPQNWRAHWTLPADLDAAARDYALHGIGNLTLVSGKLNPTLSNAPWESTPQLRGKRDTLEDHTRLELNRSLLKQHANWDDVAIISRGEQLFEEAVKIWPRDA